MYHKATPASRRDKLNHFNKKEIVRRRLYCILLTTPYLGVIVMTVEGIFVRFYSNPLICKQMFQKLIPSI